MGVGIIGAGDKRHLQQLLFPFSFVGNGGNILTRWQEDNKNLERRGKGNLWKCEHTWYLSLFYTTAIWGQEILHLKVRKFATKLSVKFFTVCNFYTVCKAIFCVPIWLTTSGCNGRMNVKWNLFISFMWLQKTYWASNHARIYSVGDFLKNFPFWTFLTQRGPVGFIPLTLCLFSKISWKIKCLAQLSHFLFKRICCI